MPTKIRYCTVSDLSVYVIAGASHYWREIYGFGYLFHENPFGGSSLDRSQPAWVNTASIRMCIMDTKDCDGESHIAHVSP